MIGEIGASLISSAASLFGAKKQNKAAAKEAQLNRDFQERMSNTAHQREVQDLRDAGLNPILSAGGGGASAPSGSQAPVVNEMSGVAHAASSALAARQMAADLENTKADTAKKKEDAILQRDLSDNARTTNMNIQWQNKILQQQYVSSAAQAARDRIDQDIYESAVGGVVRAVEKFSPSFLSSAQGVQRLFAKTNNTAKMHLPAKPIKGDALP